MKKATLSIVLVTLTMVLTSFTAPETKTAVRIADNSLISPIDGTQDSGRTRKVDGYDYMSNKTTKSATQMISPIDGTQDSGRTRKVDE